MKPSHKSSELYIIIYVLLVLGAKYLGVDISSVASQVGAIAGHYQSGDSGGSGTQLLLLALAWLGARSGLKFADIKKTGKNED